MMALYAVASCAASASAEFSAVWFKMRLVMVPAVIEPDTLSAVRAISINGSIEMSSNRDTSTRNFHLGSIEFQN